MRHSSFLTFFRDPFRKMTYVLLGFGFARILDAILWLE